MVLEALSDAEGGGKVAGWTLPKTTPKRIVFICSLNLTRRTRRDALLSFSSPFVYRLYGSISTASVWTLQFEIEIRYSSYTKKKIFLVYILVYWY